MVSAHGRVVPSAVPELRDSLVKLLADGVPVLLDLADLHLDWAPAPELFVTAVTAAGGWPLARLVLFGADAHSRPAAGLPGARLGPARPHRGRRRGPRRGPPGPPVLRRRPDPGAAVGVPGPRGPARRLPPVGIPERQDVATVVTELVTNAVVHAGTPIRLRLVLDRSGLRVSVRDRRRGPLPDPAVPDAPPGHGLRTVARLSRTWGVLLYGDGKAVWAQLPPTRARAGPEPGRSRSTTAGEPVGCARRASPWPESARPR